MTLLWFMAVVLLLLGLLNLSMLDRMWKQHRLLVELAAEWDKTMTALQRELAARIVELGKGVRAFEATIRHVLAELKDLSEERRRGLERLREAIQLPAEPGPGAQPAEEGPEEAE